MAEKRYYWLKLKDDFFDEKYMKALRRLPQGDSLAIVYLKMQLKSLQTEGVIRYEKILPDAVSELALAIDEDENIVRLAVEALIRFGVVERWDDETFYMVAVQQLIGSESASAERVRRLRGSRGKKEEAPQIFAPEKGEALQCNAGVTDCNADGEHCNRDIDTDIEKDTELEKESENRDRNPKGRKKESYHDIIARYGADEETEREIWRFIRLFQATQKRYILNSELITYLENLRQIDGLIAPIVSNMIANKEVYLAFSRQEIPEYDEEEEEEEDDVMGKENERRY